MSGNLTINSDSSEELLAIDPPIAAVMTITEAWHNTKINSINQNDKLHLSDLEDRKFDPFDI
jgi:hypothetical protein